MFEFDWLTKFISLSLATFALYYFMRSPGRSAQDVLKDLQDFYPDPAVNQNSADDVAKSISKTNVLKGLKTEILTRADAVDLASIKIPVMVGALGGAGLAILLGVTKTPVILISFVAGAALVYLVAGARLRARKLEMIQEIEQLLPVVMERLVMAVQSGLDVIAALNTVVKLDQDDRLPGQAADPVLELLGLVVNLSESGLSFVSALNQVADAVPCVALRHAFVHLALAYQEGGELVSPLRELSDATQLYYQESVEERIAKLPVKATMPLVLTFAGLLICFITAPILQVLEVLTKMTLK